MANQFQDSRPYPYDTDKPEWAAFWIALAVIVIVVLLEAMM
ncbi:hypothetical protein [Bhargavaea cecembensis]|nr:hypothetical protein [Bhargavaea cecembensis]